MQFHIGQQALDGRLVDDAFINLRHHRIAQRAQSVKQAFVVTFGIELHYKVATLQTDDNCVEVGIDVQTYEFRMQRTLLAGNVHFINQSRYAVGELHI